MSKELETKNAELETSVATLNKTVAELNVELKTEKDSVEKLTKEVASLKSDNKEVSDKLEKVVASEAVLVKEKDELAKANKSFSDELTKIKADEKKRTRITALEKAGKTAEQAEAMLKDFDGLDDVTFAKVVALIPVPEKKDELPEEDAKGEEAAKAKELEKLEGKEAPLTSSEDKGGDELQKTVASLQTWFEEIIKE